ITPSTASSNTGLICSGTSFNLSLSTASGGNGTYTYQWQSSTVSSSNGFSNYTTGGCSGPFGAFLDICNNGVSITRPTFFRAVLSSGNCSTVTSNAILINISTAPSILSQPNSISACAGSGVRVTVAISVSGINPTYTWQECNGACGSGAWTNVTNNANTTFTGANTSVLTITGITSSMNGNSYRVLVGSSCGTTSSNVLNLTTNQPPLIVTQPTSVTVCGLGVGLLSPVVSGTALTYQWQGSSTSGGTYSNLVNGVPSGVTYSTTTLTSLSITSTGLANYFYQLVASSAVCGNSATTNAAGFRTNTVIGNNLQTVVSNFICNNATTTILGSVPTGGNGSYSYQWQTSPDNSTWSNASGGTSPTTQNYSPTASLTSNTYFQRVVTSGVCSSTSTSDFITINTPPVFTLQPTSITTCTGNTVVFNVTATSSGNVQYFWQCNQARVVDSAMFQFLRSFLL
ncbi:MAG: hypothetical protein K2Q22_11775, partial [Cytophagales bacterium]|nr:hypothetical protein [Cytophagales bacterium]